MRNKILTSLVLISILILPFQGQAQPRYYGRSYGPPVVIHRSYGCGIGCATGAIVGGAIIGGMFAPRPVIVAPPPVVYAPPPTVIYGNGPCSIQQPPTYQQPYAGAQWVCGPNGWYWQ